MYGIKPESTEENRAELKRMEDLSEKWRLPNLAYKGKTNDIDMSLTWYCPCCYSQLDIGESVISNGCAVNATYKNSKEEKIHKTLVCPSHPEVCEYEFMNKHLRQLSNAWWSVGFKYPLNPLELHQLKIQKVSESIQRSEQEITKHIANIATKKKNLESLEDQLVDIKASLITNKNFFE